MNFQQSHTLPLAATWPDLLPRGAYVYKGMAPKVCSGKSILCPKALNTRVVSYALSQLVSPSFICKPHFQITGLHCLPLATS